MYIYLHRLKMQLFDPSWVALKGYSVYLHSLPHWRQSAVERLTVLTPAKSALPSVTLCCISRSLIELLWGTLSTVMAFLLLSEQRCTPAPARQRCTSIKSKSAVTKIFMQNSISSDGLSYQFTNVTAEGLIIISFSEFIYSAPDNEQW